MFPSLKSVTSGKEDSNQVLDALISADQFSDTLIADAKTLSATPIMPSYVALFPLLLFFFIFIGSGVYLTLKGQEYAFYQVSAAVAILPAIIFAIFLGKARNESLQKCINTFLEGVRNPNIIIMCLIYLLAGAFASVLQNIGGVTSTVNLALNFIPAEATLPALFLISAVVSLAMGTSMGTIAAVGPIGVGLAAAANLSLPLTMGAIVGGAMFGDNLSVISDTSIAATQIHGCTPREKFKNNLLVAIPAMIITVAILSFFALNAETTVGEFAINDYQLLHCAPYLLVLLLALFGVNVFVVLIVGIFSAGMVGLLTSDSYSLLSFSKNIFEGYKGMFEILILSLFMGGLGELIKRQGGFSALTQGLEKLFLSKRKGSTKSAEAAICTIVSISDICTANNTAAIILSGEATKEIATQNQLRPVRVATLVDLFSCVFQGILPYSAQLLMAGTLAGLSPMNIIPYVHYCFILGVIGIGTILFQRKI